jgi:protein-L-isoaspartate(D-aspartate) O-methyltransferase
VIFIGGSVERIPSALVSQLRDGGRLVTIEGSGHSASAHLYVKSGLSFSGRKIFNVATQPLPGFTVPKAFVF